MILFTVIEGDNNNINNNSGNVKVPRMYEQEAIKCFTEWRNNAGWLKDIEIVCYCPTNNKPSNNTITNDIVTLGRVLFYDKNMSSNNTTS